VIFLFRVSSALASAVAVALCSGLAGGQPPPDHALIYELLADSSTVRAHTGSSGLLGFAGHDHTIAVPSLSGRVRVDTTDVTRFTLAIEVPATALVIADPGEDEGKRAKIEKDMHEKVLAAGEFPSFSFSEVRFAPETLAAPETPAATFGSHRGELTVALTLHGVTREIRIPVTIDVDRQTLRARGKFAIKHADFHLTRIKVAGLVNVAETIDIEFDMVGRVMILGTGP
jgi:polyisoprenoid-binding protein YceI